MNHTAVSADTSTPMKPKNTNIVYIIIVIMWQHRPAPDIVERTTIYWMYLDFQWGEDMHIHIETYQSV
jgi:hypothetical protein